jgi:hypothetical protein
VRAVGQPCSCGSLLRRCGGNNIQPVSRGTYLIFVSKPTGYELREREGEPPPAGTEVEEEDGRMWVTKIAPSPLPGDQRRCVYLLPVS